MPAHTIRSNSFKTHFNIIFHLRLDRTSALSLRLPHQLSVRTSPLLSPFRVICPAYFILLHLVTRIVPDEVQKSWRSLLSSLLHFLEYASLLGSNIFLSTIFWNMLNLNHVSLPQCDRPPLQPASRVKTEVIRSGHILCVPVFWGSQISRQLAHEGGKFVNTTNRTRFSSWNNRLSRTQVHNAARRTPLVV